MTTALSVVPATATATPSGAAGAVGATDKVSERALRVVRASAGTVYFVDPSSGSDANSGRSRSRALRTLTQVGSIDLSPGDTVRLKAGERHIGGVWAAQSGSRRAPITLTRYGVGSAPVVRDDKCVQIAGDHWRVTRIKTVGCAWAGFQVFGDHVVLQRVEATKGMFGIAYESGADDGIVRRSHIHDNRRMASGTTGRDDDYGAQGILVSGDRLLIERNRIDGHFAPSPDYGVDGAAIEIFGAVGTRIRRNTARNNINFTELGDSRTRNTRYSYNVVTSNRPTAQFVVTRGAKDHWGPVHGTVMAHNSVRLSGQRSSAINCYGGCTRKVLTLRSSVISAASMGYARLGGIDDVDGPVSRISAGHNVFTDRATGFLTRGTDRFKPAGFVAPARGDLRLRRTSAAVDIGGRTAGRRDRAGRGTRLDGDCDGKARPDAGAYERPAC